MIWRKGQNCLLKIQCTRKLEHDEKGKSTFSAKAALQKPNLNNEVNSESKVSILSWIVSQLSYAEDTAYSDLNDLLGFLTKLQSLTLPELQKCAKIFVSHDPNGLEASLYNELVQFKSIVDAGDDQVQTILHMSKLLVQQVAY